MPRRAHPLLLIVSLALGLLLAFGLAACGSGGSSSAQTLETPPLTVATNATLPGSSAPSTTTTATTTTSTTTASSSGATSSSSSGAASSGSGTAATGTAGGGQTQQGNGGGGAPTAGGGGGGTGTGTTAKPANPGGAASPDYQSFCKQNPGAC